MTDDRPRNDTGKYDDQLPPETVLEVFDRRDDLARPLTSNDVMESPDCARRTALNKLNELVAAGSLESRDVGACARVFWRPIPGDDHDARLKQLSAELGQPISVGETVYESGDNHPIESTGDSGSESDTEYNLSGPEQVADPADEGGVLTTASVMKAINRAEKRIKSHVEALPRLLFADPLFRIECAGRAGSGCSTRLTAL